MADKCQWEYKKGQKVGQQCTKRGIHGGWCNDHKNSGPKSLEKVKAPPKPPRKPVPQLVLEEEPQQEEQVNEDVEYEEDTPFNDDEIEELLNEEEEGEEEQEHEVELESDMKPQPSKLGRELKVEAQKEITATEKLNKLAAKARDINKVQRIKKVAENTGNSKLMQKAESLEDQIAEVEDVEDLEEIDEEGEDIPMLDEGVDPAVLKEQAKMMLRGKLNIKAVQSFVPIVPVLLEEGFEEYVKPRTGYSVRGMTQKLMSNRELLDEFKQSFMDTLAEQGIFTEEDAANMPAWQRMSMLLGSVMVNTAIDNKFNSAPTSKATKALADQLDD